MSPEQFQSAVLHWYDQHGRKNLPWQVDKNHYRVWVSEIMLQQTQVTTVIPYFHKFMERFPTIESLAHASVDEVLRYWSGLGYYARARNLHKSAQIIMHDYQGQFPRYPEQLEKLPGIGRSTAAAILALTEEQPLAILDGNVKRVLSRFMALKGWSGDQKISEKLWQTAEQLTPSVRVADYTQVMMDIGATLCTRTKPKCLLCPLQQHCQAFLQGATERYPGKKPKVAYPTRYEWFLVLQTQDQLLLHKRPASGIWGGLWTLPSFDSMEKLQQWLELRSSVCEIEAWKNREHKFTHYRLIFTPIVVTIDKKPITEESGMQWHFLKDVDTLGLPAPIKVLLKELIVEEVMQ